ncbi:GOLPH3/VPS74 family protein [Actinocrispum wychmicini]|uniref:Golgi phosphoprotein 3 GPP34 n=1 Tax=Actinocrispum wychmicini TaxID=1213861 RepID=A0A4V2S6L8_9PSEU|nr:GPP34 family phosphoprotein [Actinocrispum wychmicini]TCO56590.1 Golgi phosphoprotein 3 GPP34 [Actinocrispum wychmicini]
MPFAGLSLCECLFFLGHDPFTGRARVGRNLLDIGLSGAVLADLLFHQRITLDHGTVVLTGRYDIGEPVADRALALVVGETDQHGARDWVEYLRELIFDSVVETLAVRQLVTPKEKRGMFKLTLSYQPTELRIASEPRARVRSAMLGRTTCDLPTAVLAHLAWTIGLDDICDPDLTRREAADWIEQSRAKIVDPMAGVLSAVESAVAADVYGGNRG